MALTLIEQSTLPSNASSFTFSSIPQDYVALMIVYSTTGAGFGDTIGATISLNGNAVSSSNAWITNGVTSTSSRADDRYSGGLVGPEFTDNKHAKAVIYLPNYSSSNNKLVYARFGKADDSATVQGISHSRWNSSNAVTSVTFTPQSSNDYRTNGTIFTLYGIS